MVADHLRRPRASGDRGTPEHLAVSTIFNRYNEVSITLADNP
jgi:hypothetical protein